jgi:hypothetical protein
MGAVDDGAMTRENTVWAERFLSPARSPWSRAAVQLQLTAHAGGSIMINLNRLGIGGIVFLIGAVIYIINLAFLLTKRRSTIPIDGVGLMVLGLGMALLLRW